MWARDRHPVMRDGPRAASEGARVLPDADLLVFNPAKPDEALAELQADWIPGEPLLPPDDADHLRALRLVGFTGSSGDSQPCAWRGS
jgi:hypothetical protein